MMSEQKTPMVIQIRNDHVHNLKHIDVDIPLNKIVGIAGVSGRSGHPEHLRHRVGASEQSAENGFMRLLLRSWTSPIHSE